METIGIVYKVNTVTKQEVLTHLRECNNNFFPPLAERVNVDEYAQKIFEKSVTFEAWNGKTLAGLLAAYFNDISDNSVFITNVSVLKDFMGLGIASKLLEECIGYGYKENFKEIKLEVRWDNHHAIGLYRKFDFKIDGKDKDYLKMKLELSK